MNLILCMVFLLVYASFDLFKTSIGKQQDNLPLKDFYAHKRAVENHQEKTILALVPGVQGMEFNLRLKKDNSLAIGQDTTAKRTSVTGYIFSVKLQELITPDTATWKSLPAAFRKYDHSASI